MTKRVFWAAFVLLLALCCLVTAYCIRSFGELAGLSEIVYVTPV